MPPLNWGPLDSVHRRCPINAHWVKEGPSDLRWGPPRQDHCPPSSVWSRDSDQGCRPAGLGLEEFPDRFVSILFVCTDTFYLPPARLVFHFQWCCKISFQNIII